MQIILAGLIVTVSAAQLTNNYLPPNGAKGAGGSGGFLNTPFGGSPFKPAAANNLADGSSTRSSPSSAEARAAILRFNNENNGDGSYQFE